MIAAPVPSEVNRGDSRVIYDLLLREQLRHLLGKAKDVLESNIKLERTQTRLDKAHDGSKRAAKLAAEEADLLVRFDRLDVRRDERRQAVDEVAALEASLEAVRAVALAKAGGSGTTKRRFYRADD